MAARIVARVVAVVIAVALGGVEAAPMETGGMLPEGLATTMKTAALAEVELGLEVKDDGSFTVLHDGRPWLVGGEVVVDGLSSSNGGLVLTSPPTASTGTDKLGNYHAQSFTWSRKPNSNNNDNNNNDNDNDNNNDNDHDNNDAKPDEAAAVVVTSFRTYEHDPGMVVFSQRFPNAVPLVSAARRQELSEMEMNVTVVAGRVLTCTPTGCQQTTGSPPTARTSFPTFVKSTAPSLTAHSYHGVFPSMSTTPLSHYTPSFQGGAPLTLYDGSNKSLPMTVFSPLNSPKAHHMTATNTSFGAGIKSTATLIPAGYEQLFLLSAGLGINDGTMAWGDRLLAYTGKPRADMHAPGVVSTIGFWTDNGGFYHYDIGNNASLGSNYEQVLIKVKEYHDTLWNPATRSHGVPFKHWQFDSWFYPKDGGVNPGGGGGAVTNWTSLDSVFPHGMAYIQDKLGVPMVMHNRQWSIHSDYMHNLTYKWYTSAKAAVPEDPEAFFKYFFTQQEGWGLAMYEQDWMCTEYEEVEALQTNLTLADMWLEGMATGAQQSNRTVQYCMPYPNDVLCAAALPAVTNARATGDYFHTDHQWAVGATSLMYWAIGVLPFKDGFYSSSLKQLGGQTEGPELNPDRETLMATLSCAMVGPMDGYGLLNTTRVMATCRADGVILKPDRPLTTVDWCFQDGRTGDVCWVYSTHSDVVGLGRVTHVYIDDSDTPFVPEMAGLTTAHVAAGSHALVNWYTREYMPMTSVQRVAAGYEGHVYLSVVPVLDGWVLFGETDKYVPYSSLRIQSVRTKGTDLEVVVAGAAGVDEYVEMCAAHVSTQGKLQCIPLLVRQGSGPVSAVFRLDDRAPAALVPV